MRYPECFDVIVIGGGHAGTEACMAAARLGCHTLLLTHNIETLGQMSCNPAIGGIGKGHLVKEIDALGGVMARAADAAGIQFRILNRRKGPAVRATRAQADRVLYKAAVRKTLENQPNLLIFQQAVTDLIVEQETVIGIRTQADIDFYAGAVVLTTGTFLGGIIHLGMQNYQGGRAGDPPANALAARLRELPLKVARLKTGTPPRIDSKTIDFAKLGEQPGDAPTPVFSYLGSPDQHPRQVSCWITRTSARTHDIIRASLDRSPLYAGVIEGTGPRYCPSIEDKIVRFAAKDSHQIFIEPEGLNTHEIYPNGISTSLPFDVQINLVRSIAGLENAHITRPGYAIEYDFFDPRDLYYSLENKYLKNLYFAGQINGTTGYEEAAAQGLLAGLNAARQVQGLEPWHPRRDQAYLGVLIDDLITQGATEPYRMFTSRAEHRLLLREDNADLRLTETAYKLGLIDEHRWQVFNRKRDAIEQERQRLHSTWIRPAEADPTQVEEVLNGALSREFRASELLRRPNVTYARLMQLAGPGVTEPDIAEQVEIQIKYAGYIDRQQEEIASNLRNEALKLPLDLNYQQVPGLSAEVQEKLNQIKPTTLGQASRIAGVTPAAISLLRIYLKRRYQPDLRQSA